MKQKLEKWNRWLGTIQKEVIELVTNQHTFWKIQNMININPNIQKPNSFYQFIGQSYHDYGVIALRRQIKYKKNDKYNISFVKLLKEIIEIPCLLSRERFVNLYGIDMKGLANKIYDQRFSGECTDHIDPAIVQRDLEELQAHGGKMGKLEDFADKRIAHYDRREPKIPSFYDLDAGINCLEKLTIKYTLLFEGRDLGENLVIEFAEDYWEEIFSQPWIVDTTGQTYNSLEPVP